MSERITPSFITEDYLRQHFNVASGTEIHLPPGTRFTPSAQQWLNEKQIQVRFRDESGQVFAPGKDGEDAEALEKVHPLKNNNIRPENNCVLCGMDVTPKPALMTHLNDKVLVPKTHPRIQLRSQLDICISYCVIVQCAMKDKPSLLQSFMADIRSYLGKVLQSEVTEQTLPELALGEFPSSVVHKWSHFPLRHLGHDHLLPELTYGDTVAQLNYLRALVRQLELTATQVFLDDTLQLSRDDIVAGLNRLSSAIYVVAILTLQCERGNCHVLKELSHDVA